MARISLHFGTSDRIPLYIPPFAIAPNSEARYRELEEAITRLIIKGQLEDAEVLKRNGMI
jgi:hypothetical protein